MTRRGKVKAMQTRERVHQLIDELPDNELDDVERFLAQRGAGGSAFRRALESAPEEDEPVSPEEAAAIEEAYADVAAGRVLTDDELWRRLGHAPKS